MGYTFPKLPYTLSNMTGTIQHKYPKSVIHNVTNEYANMNVRQEQQTKQSLIN